MTELAARHGADAAVSDTSAALASVRTFHTLDALRGLAAVAVVLFHTAFIYGIARPAEGQVAVDLFFVMSGFIIAHRYGDPCRAMSLASFIKVRLIRLYPLCLLGSVLGVVPLVLAMAAGHHDAVHRGLVASFPLAVAMLPSPFAMPTIDEIYPLNYVVWSLSLEIIVNIVYAATISFWSPRRLVMLLAAAFVALCVCAWWYGTLHGGFDWANAPLGPPRAIYGFAMGVLIHQLHIRQVHLNRRLGFPAPWWALVVICGAMFFCNAPFGRAWWELFLVTIAVPVIVVAAVGSEPPRAARSACAIAGVFSYVVYSLHMPLVGFILRGEDALRLDSHKQTATEAMIFTALLVALCLVAHYAYDKPVRRFLSRSLAAKRYAAP